MEVDRISGGGKLSLTYSHFYPLIVLNAFTIKSHLLAVRLYRPGYETVEVKAWSSAPIVWKPLHDVKDQAKAVDALVTDVFASESPAHRRMLLFAADEYERLAGRNAEDRQMLLYRAAELRDKAQLKKSGGQESNLP
jgi:hypothetical protein